MEYGIFDVITLIGALGFFIYGMKVMSEGIQKLAGDKMRDILSAMTSNRFFGILTGLLITALVQSSSATTVMTVSFVNAGLLSLVESIGVILGANIGTTFTSWLVTYLGFKIKISVITLPIIAVGFPLMFSQRSSLKSLAELLIGFALLFMGLEHLKDAVPNLHENPEILSFLANYTNYGVFSVLIFVAIGTILTIVVQSSSAAMALTLVMCNEGWIPFDMAVGIVLGENIGTTITANLAALIANVHAKRAARAHFIVNVFGVVWMLFALPLVLRTIDDTMVSFGKDSPYDDPHQIPLALSIFHTAFNSINVLILVWFVKPIEKLVTKMVPSKGKFDDMYTLEYISTGVMGTPELALLEARKEVAKFGRLTHKMLGFFKELFIEKEPKKINKRLAKLQKYEDITDRIEIEIADYLLKVSAGELTDVSSLRIRSMLSTINDLERIGDVIYQMSKLIERKIEDRTWFTPEQRNNMTEMLGILDQMFEEMIKILDQDYSKANIDKLIELHKSIISSKAEMRKIHLMSVEKGDYNIRSGLIYADLYTDCEKIGDFILNIAEAIKGKV
tara:strand:+ start:5993 stop:7681 length:1689 start_codon:yes stop_codon:yes gene_type:complete